MPQNEARSWWAEVADVRESIERRRAGDAPASASADPGDELAHVRARRAMAARKNPARFEREAPRRTPPPRPRRPPRRAARGPAAVGHGTARGRPAPPARGARRAPHRADHRP